MSHGRERRSTSRLKPLIYLGLELIAIGLASYLAGMLLESVVMGFVVFVIAVIVLKSFARTKQFRERAKHQAICNKYKKDEHFFH